jgi:MFS family permease
VGSLPAGLVVKRIGYRKTMALMAILTAIGSALTSIGRAINDNFPLIVISRVVIGITSSLACVACPLYVEVSSSPSTKKVFGVFFQVFCTFGIFLAAAIGLGLEPKGDFFINGGLSLEFRLHFVALFPLLFSLFFIFLSFTIPLRNNTVNSGEETKLVNADTGDLNHETPSVVKPLIAATALCIAQQFTGINAIMNYSGQITNTFGLQPLQGNILVMTWNFITTLVSIPLAQKVPPRTSFICATVLACVGCVISGIAAFPGIIHTPAVSNALGATGVALFVAVFELGMGCFFWVLASSIFPPHFRETGMGLTNMFQFILNVAINFGFLVCVQALSGGESGNQNKGLAIMFFIFAGFGIATVPVLLAFLRQYDAPKRIN